MKKLIGLIVENKNISASIFFIVFTSLIFKDWNTIFTILSTTVYLSIVINLVNWLYKVFKAEDFSFFKQLLVWLKIMPIFVSLFLLIIFYAFSFHIGNPISNNKSIMDTIVNSSSKDIIEDSTTNDINYQLEELKKERENLQNEMRQKNKKRIKNESKI